LLHLGHARTFWIAQQRARECSGVLVLRNEDLDPQRSRGGFVSAFLEDLRWFGIEWQEGPDIGGPFGPYHQSERLLLYRSALRKLQAVGFVYPCQCSRKDLQHAASAPHTDDDEMIYPGTCRPLPEVGGQKSEVKLQRSPISGLRPAWRFLVPDGETITFIDGHFGEQHFVAGRDFGDFVVWRGDDVPAYQLACVVDDAAMEITEVVRGADLLVSTARQLLLYRALGLSPPAWFHCPLFTDESGQRLAKRHDALSLRRLRELGKAPDALRRS
jgi:glutamyl-tRNA synthetase